MCGYSLYAMEIKNDIASEQVFVFKPTSYLLRRKYIFVLYILGRLSFWSLLFFFFFLPDSILEIKKKTFSF